MNFLKGQILAFDKPYGWTSFQMVAKIRRLLTLRMDGVKIKVGHAGTLDPLATVSCWYVRAAPPNKSKRCRPEKEYIATLRLGATTPSFDLEHSIDALYPTDHISEDDVRRVLKQFEGDINQVPPTFSACKIQGKRAYDLARKGKDVELKAKTIHIDHIELLDCRLPIIKIRVACSKGTYIRALARDIGQALGSGAHLTALQRTQVGQYTLEHCFQLSQFETWLNEQTVETTLDD